MNPSTHPIHPTTSTSTHERATVDGSTIEATKARLEHEEQTLAAEIEHLGQQMTNALRRQLALNPPNTTETTETTDQSRPVVGLVAHVVDLDAIEAREDEHYAVRVDVPALVAEVRRLREREAALIRAKDVDLDDVRDRLADVEAARAADSATIGVLAAAVAKVAAIHVDDGDGWCKACQTLGYPCPTVLALGAGR